MMRPNNNNDEVFDNCEGEIMEGVIEDKSEFDSFITELIKTRSLDKTKVIILLQEIQEKFGYLSREAIQSISKQLKVPEIDIFGVATFYAQFRFNKPGKYPIKVCEGTACHVRGSKDIVSAIERELKISHGQTTNDGLFSMERVACMGCCALAPVMVVSNEVYGSMTTGKVSEILNQIRGEK